MKKVGVLHSLVHFDVLRAVPFQGTKMLHSPLPRKDFTPVCRSACPKSPNCPYLIFDAFADDVGEIPRCGGGIALAAGHVAQAVLGNGGSGGQREGQHRPQRQRLHFLRIRSQRCSSSGVSGLLKGHRARRAGIFLLKTQSKDTRLSPASFTSR